MAKAPYFITGPVGASKTSTTVSLIVGYLNEGRPVATNIDIFPERMRLTELGKKTSIIRLPDEPRSTDLLALGHAYDKEVFGYNEAKNGMLALDETAFFMNSREWNKPDRMQLIKFLRLIRKKGWNAFLLVQDIDSIDSQIVNSLCRSIGWCYTSENLTGASGNFASSIILFPFKLFFNLVVRVFLRAPRLHFCTFYAGKSIANGLKHDTHSSWGYWLYNSYDTAQEFGDGGEFLDLPVRNEKGEVKVSFQVGKDIQYRFVPFDAALTNPVFTIERETVYRDFRAVYTVLPVTYLDAWYPNGVPSRPLTVEQSAKAVAESRKLSSKKSTSVKKNEIYPVSFWLTLPVRVILYITFSFAAKFSGHDWRFLAASHGCLKG